MRKFVLAAFLLASAPSLAGSYDDFNQGMTLFTEGKSLGMAIAAFSRAIAAGDLTPGLLPTAYLDRGMAYLRTGRCDLARADFDSALELRPGIPQTVLDRGRSELCMRQFDAALADFTTVTASNPSGLVYFNIGRVHWMMGDFASAGNDFQKALKLNPQHSYSLLWLGISQLRDKDFDAPAFANYFSDMSVDDWPLPVLDLFLGKITVAELVAEAAKGDAKDVQGHKCEADFYAAEWQLTHGNVAASQAMFQDAAKVCPKNFVERAPAELELKRLQ